MQNGDRKSQRETTGNNSRLHFSWSKPRKATGNESQPVDASHKRSLINQSFVSWYQIYNKCIKSLEFRGFSKRIQRINRSLVKIISILTADFHSRSQGVRLDTERSHVEVDPFHNLESGSPDINEIL